ncbi:hypothetical protein CRYUN_Cryun26dG0059000 [Craigia yunnanensis]
MPRSHPRRRRRSVWDRSGGRISFPLTQRRLQLANFLGGSQAVRMNAPRVGGSFAVWGGRSLELRSAGGFLQMRQGLGASARSALFGGVLLALIEGAGIMLNKVLSAQENMPLMIEDPGHGVGLPMGIPGHTENEVGSSSFSGWFGGWFIGGKKKDEGSSGGAKTEILESFDAPPMPTFELK